MTRYRNHAIGEKIKIINLDKVQAGNISKEQYPGIVSEQTKKVLGMRLMRYHLKKL